MRSSKSSAVRAEFFREWRKNSSAKVGSGAETQSSAERSGFEGALNKGFGTVRASKVVLIN